MTFGFDNLNFELSALEFRSLDQCFLEPIAVHTYLMPVSSLHIHVLEAGWQFTRFCSPVAVCSSRMVSNELEPDGNEYFAG